MRARLCRHSLESASAANPRQFVTRIAPEAFLRKEKEIVVTALTTTPPASARRPRRMASHRIGARVAGLSPEQLCAIIEAQAGASDAALRVAEEHAARLVEQPEWVLSEVLLSPDLAPHILAQLPTKAHTAKGTRR
ncbi:hypothetical protein EMIHUDRAFT_206341 [Emiliania huxleyi CCMP1516]|uniref:Uncharacterized protein n=2 Tax=Emiliania huxleyi TaxID=2903 RepID=A0A0D3JNU8_EMIH1|nr:hypothetical protein EMIHUDRAFT_206341 [Emiliania huxleyi CCMP1516]EOD25183.1 hypothetical protein EMIHUDRAFT_206341 [Emiliania huxleyi CCMP1516]|eukprot:XP_005777612.1 hypothetical protein EMIHUDRAFT_206341 [Emiliania huxleyi CCMP1516]